jgi:hypothetical protein
MIPSQRTHLEFGTGVSMRTRSVRYFLSRWHGYEELLCSAPVSVQLIQPELRSSPDLVISNQKARTTVLEAQGFCHAGRELSEI